MKIIHKFLVFFPIFTIGLILNGCSTTPMVWTKYGADQESYSRDKYYCMMQSQQRFSQFRFGTAYDIYNGAYVDRVVTNEELFKACMNANGWYLQPLPPIN